MGVTKPVQRSGCRLSTSQMGLHCLEACGDRGSSCCHCTGRPPPAAVQLRGLRKQGLIRIDASQRGSRFRQPLIRAPSSCRGLLNSSSKQRCTLATRSGTIQRQAVSKRSPSCTSSPSTQRRIRQPTSSGPDVHGSQGTGSSSSATEDPAPDGSSLVRAARSKVHAQPNPDGAPGPRHPQDGEGDHRGRCGANETADRGVSDVETFQSTPIARPAASPTPM